MIHSLDAWLWRQGIDHPVIRLVLRNEMLFSTLFLVTGVALFAFTSWIFWFGAGAFLLVWTLWALARFFLHRELGDFSSAFLRVVIVRWLARFLIMGVLLYVAIVIFHAPAMALAGGLAAAGLCAVGSYAQAARHLRGGVK
ncbi:MAG: hypothetical protein J5861_03545 [Desulfovibrio sp.]|nr:hypothetical protein [Desulfovibrio sp.]